MSGLRAQLTLVAILLLAGCAGAPYEDAPDEEDAAEVGAETTGPTPRFLENGGVGTGYDGTPLVGKHFPSVPSGGTVTSVCAYMLPGPTSVSYALAVSPRAPTRLHEGAIAAPARAGWACDAVSVPWTATSLFVFRTGGTANVSFEMPVRDGDSHHFHSGAWHHQPEIARGYRVEWTRDAGSGASFLLENGGVGTGFDRTPLVGKFFREAPVGRVTSVCAYVGSDSGTVDYALAVSPTEQTPLHRGTIVAAAADGYVCDAASVAWSAPSLFVTRTGGDGVVSYEQPVREGDSYHFHGGRWQLQQDVTRGYRVTIES